MKLKENNDWTRPCSHRIEFGICASALCCRFVHLRHHWYHIISLTCTLSFHYLNTHTHTHTHHRPTGTLAMMTTGQTFDPRGSFGGNRSVLLLRWNGRPGSTESVWMQCSEESTSSQLTKQLSLQVCQDTFLQRVSSTVFCLRVHLYMPTNFDHPVRPPEPISTNRLNCHSTCHLFTL